APGPRPRRVHQRLGALHLPPAVRPRRDALTSWPALQPGFFAWCLAFGVCQTLSTLALSKALKLADISLVTALWKVSLLILLGMAWATIGERPSALGVAGVLLSAGGAYLLHVPAGHLALWDALRVPAT